MKMVHYREKTLSVNPNTAFDFISLDLKSSIIGQSVQRTFHFSLLELLAFHFPCSLL